ncbi:MAG: efflux RND transporter periplasmic adaptor subunit [Verrucomicrobia bacterium]|nr:efflux RND transporter periplasmic adaptor subunit [Verrucomicrobiota bacterium]
MVSPLSPGNAPRPKFPRGLGFLALTGVGLGLGLAVTGCQPAKTTEARGATETVEVKVSSVENRPWEQVLTVLGSLEAVDRATLSTKNTGRLKQLLVDVGSPVKAGDVLAQVEPKDYELRLNQSAALLGQARVRVGLPLEGTDDSVEEEKVSTVREARALMEEAKKGLERIQKLQEQNISSQAEFERATAEYQVMLNRYSDALQEARERKAILAQRRAEFEIARQAVQDTSLRAPFDGVVQARLTNVGEFLPAGSPVLTVVQVDPLRLRLDVPERQSMSVQVGQPIRVSFDGDTNHYTGTVARVSPALDQRTRLLRVEGQLKNPGHLRPGAFARAEIVVAEAIPGLAIPADALITFAGTEKALLVLTNTAVERRLVTGRRQGPWIEVLQGLRAGDAVIRNPGGLPGGTPVRPSPVPATAAAS